MELKEVLLKRRSVRKFTGQAVPQEYIEELFHAAMSGPSACNKRPWAFYAVTNEAVLEALRASTHFGKIPAKLAIVVCGDLKRALPQQMAAYWIQDCSAATENILLRATDLGLGAVWCGVHPQPRAEKLVGEALGLAENLVPLNIIYLGYPAEEPEARDQYEAECIHYIH